MIYFKHKKVSIRAAIITLWSCVLTLCAPFTSMAQDLPNELSARELFAKVRIEWNSVEGAIKKNDFSTASDSIKKIITLRTQHGYESAEYYSHLLLVEAEARLKNGDLDRAFFLTQKALELSPDRAPVLLRATWVNRGLGKQNIIQSFFSVVSQIPSHPIFIIRLIEILTYPILWSLTLALYITMVGYGGIKYPLVRLKLEKKFKKLLPILPGLLLVPVLVGPLWSIFAFSLLLWWSTAEKWILWSAATVIMLWGALIPLRDTLEVFLERPEFRAALSESMHDLAPIYGDDGAERTLMLRPDDSFAQAASVSARFHRSDVDGMERIMKYLPDGRWKDSMHVAARFMANDSAGALRGLEGLKNFGGTRTMYNLSRVHFDLLHVEEGRAFFSAAQQLDSEESAQYELRDQILAGKKLLLPPEIPLSWVLASAFKPIANLRPLFDARAHAVMFGMNPLMLLSVGAVLALLALRKKKLQVLEPKPEQLLIPPGVMRVLRALPGGVFLATRQLRYGVAILAFSILLILPLFGWPGAHLVSMRALEGLFWSYSVGVMLVVLLLIVSLQYIFRGDE